MKTDNTVLRQLIRKAEKSTVKDGISFGAGTLLALGGLVAPVDGGALFLFAASISLTVYGSVDLAVEFKSIGEMKSALRWVGTNRHLIIEELERVRAELRAR
ncbi:MAG: hypothetical protein AAGE86_06935 [Pseudomonadota bacterium]